MAKRRGGHSGGGHASSERWLLTYADLITLLLILFILLYAISNVDQSKLQKLSDAMAQAFNVIPSQGGAGDSVLPPGSRLVMPPVAPMFSEAEFEKLEKQASGSQGDIEVHPEQRGWVISIAGESLFEGGSAEIRPAMRARLDQIARTLEPSSNRVLIEGHTDDVPIRTARFPTNWELSTSRATSVLRYLISSRGLPPGRFAASGYGEHYPRVPNDSPQNRARNRRVDIVILRGPAAKEGPAAKGGEQMPPGSPEDDQYGH